MPDNDLYTKERKRTSTGVCFVFFVAVILMVGVVIYMQMT